MRKWSLPSNPDEIQPVPWLSEMAIAYFETLLTKDMTVLEFGGGGSTLWLAERVRQVVTVEPNKAWMDKLQSIRPENVRLENKHVPDMTNCDLLFVDGEPVTARAWWIYNAPTLIKNGGILVIDNANRPEYSDAMRFIRASAEMLDRFTADGGKYFVTEFYRMK